MGDLTMRQLPAVHRAVIVALMLAAGCMRWAAAPGNLQPDESSTLRAHLRDGTTVKLTRASVRPDSVIGIPWGSTVQDARVAYARTDIVYLETGKADVVGSIGGTIVVLFAIIGLLGVIAVHTLRHMP